MAKSGPEVLDDSDDRRVKIETDMVALGDALRWPAVDAQGKLLLNRGAKVSTANQLDLLLDKGYFRMSAREYRRYLNPAAPAPVEPAAPEAPAPVIVPGEHMQLYPEMPIQLSHATSGQEERFMAHVLGVKRGTSLMVTLTGPQAPFFGLQTGAFLKARLFSGKDIFSFATQVLQARHEPFAYLHLTYPKSVQMLPVRRTARTDIEVAATLHDFDTGKLIDQARIVDLSTGGARLALSPDTVLRGPVLLRFQAPGAEGPEGVEVECELCGAARMRADGQKLLRLKFRGLQPLEKLAVTNLVYHELLTRHGIAV